MDRPALAEHVSDEIAAALRLTTRSASRLLDAADGLQRLPGVLAALGRGEIDWAKAGLFTDLLTGLPDDDAARSAAGLLGRAGGMPTGQLRAALTRAILACDPDAARQRQDDARAEAGVHAWTETSGNAALAGRELATADVIHARTRLTALARWLHTRGAAGTMDQLRAAVYIALLTGRPVQALLPHDNPAPDPRTDCAGNTGASGPDAGSRDPDPADVSPQAGDRPPGDARAGDPTPGDDARADDPALTGGGWPQLTGTVNLTMPMSAWLGLTDNPGEAASHGPVDARTGRDLTARLDPATRWCLTLTDPAGHAVAHACARGRPPSNPARDLRPANNGPPGSRPQDHEPPGTVPATLTWAAGLAARMQTLQAGTCSHPRESVSYRPPLSLRHLIVLRQRTCTAPAAAAPPPTATSTTPSPTTRAAAPANATSGHSADATTGPSRHPAGTSSNESPAR